jgi:hypothetical protein
MLKRCIGLKEKFASYIFFITGIIDIIVAIFNFNDNKISFGIVYLCLAIVFFSLAVRFKNKHK